MKICAKISINIMYVADMTVKNLNLIRNKKITNKESN